MPRSFGLVEAKLQEAEYFFDRIQSHENGFFGVQCDAVAFASSARSITFALQASLRGINGFEGWYSAKQQALRDEPLARFFHEFRRVSQHIGGNVVAGGASNSGSPLFYFGPIPEIEKVPELDVVSACDKYLRLLLELVYDCHLMFREIINGQWYFTLEHFSSKGLTIEDAEQELGLPAGWSAVSGLPEELRWKFLRKEADGCNIQGQFEFWLGKRVPHPDDET